MANRIQELRKEKRITQVRLSIELEVSQETISAYEHGKYYPSVDTLIRLRKILDASIDYILGLSDQRYPSTDSLFLRKDEQYILEKYKLLSMEGKERTRGYIDGCLTSMERKSD